MSALNNNDLRHLVSSSLGLDVNEHNRIYQRGAALSIDQKAEIGVRYLQAMENANGNRPTLLNLQRPVRLHVQRLPRSKRSLSNMDVYVVRRRLGRIVTNLKDL